MAVKKPTGDNARKGAVRKRTQLKNKLGLGQAQQEVRHGCEEPEKFKAVRR